MFLKTGELKKIMKASLKRSGLYVGNVNNHYLVYSDRWGVYVDHAFASNKFKAAIMELIGDLPEPYECYLFTIDSDKQITQKVVLDYPDPYEDWKEAKDATIATPILLFAWPHEYMVYQRKSDLKFVTVLRSLTDAVISASELETDSEHMPKFPDINGNTLYYKNESTIYWVGEEYPGEKALKVLFPQLAGLSFFEDDWMVSTTDSVNESDGVSDNETENDAVDSQLPY